MIGSAQLRQMYLEFFETKGHKVLPSFSLIPREDPTLLLTGAGMVPLKPYFLGKAKPESTRLTTSQKCIRTADLESVGKVARYCTFFEMLGNFSFGDYFKEEAIEWAWEFVRDWMKLPLEKIWVTVYQDDDEAFELWNQKMGVPAERIVRLGKETNFWELGVGPCGPNSELFVDLGKERGCDSPDCGPDCDCGRFLEFWNLVFIQFHRDENGEYHRLEKPGIDTGMGLERMSVILQGVENVFEIDLNRPIVEAMAQVAGKKYGQESDVDAALRVITDHSRSMVHMVSDGILPSNEGRGYVLRRILRRAIRYARLIGVEEPFLTRVGQVVIAQMGEAYPDLVRNEKRILQVIQSEEERFQAALDQGLSLLDKLVAVVRAKGKQILSGEDVFRLYDTYGFPPELTQEILSEQGMDWDRPGFEQAMEAQRERARSARGESSYLDEASTFYGKLAQDLGSEFLGYENLEIEAQVLKVLSGQQILQELGTGQKGEVILDQTPFYPEAGGQVADTGLLKAPGVRVRVEGVTRPAQNLVVHKVVVEEGVLRPGISLTAQVDPEIRQATASNHTATHLAHKALKEVLGDHVQQAGSLVSSERLRFDFSHFQAMTPAQLQEVEERVNAEIRKNHPVQIAETTLEEAQARGAMALFEAKYGEKVRLVQVGEYSLELCGGTHLRSSGEIGLFAILGESSVAAGVRRIEALTGRAAWEYLTGYRAQMKAVANHMRVGTGEVLERVSRLQDELKLKEAELKRMEAQLATSSSRDLLSDVQEIQGVKLLATQVQVSDVEALRTLADQLRDKLGSGVVVLGVEQEGKAILLAAITRDLAGQVHAGKLIGALAPIVDGRGGGRPDMAQAGGNDPGKIGTALGQAGAELAKQLG